MQMPQRGHVITVLRIHSVAAVMNAAFYTHAVIRGFPWAIAFHTLMFFVAIGMAYKYWCKLRGKR